MENKTKTQLEKQNEITKVPIEILIDNPNSPSRMSKTTFAKLVRNIERTGLYEPIIVRKSNTQYEIINGHNRVKALRQLAYTTVDVCIWDVDDNQVDIFLATLNRLSGTSILEKKLALINRLSENLDAKKLAQLLPLTAGQIERYRSLKLPCKPARQDRDNFAEPLVFFINKKQKQTIEQAFSMLQKADSKLNARKTKSEAITMLAESFIKVGCDESHH
ncbi:MAG: ParB-like nuclease domain-containing protein [Sedimentisphaerales bacterium]|nr:ParB-like nuclease domain-containing protein [Sedimentisphaerales bacterium]